MLPRSPRKLRISFIVTRHTKSRAECECRQKMGKQRAHTKDEEGVQLQPHQAHTPTHRARRLHMNNDTHLPYLKRQRRASSKKPLIARSPPEGRTGTCSGFRSHAPPAHASTPRHHAANGCQPLRLSDFRVCPSSPAICFSYRVMVAADRKHVVRQAHRHFGCSVDVLEELCCTRREKRRRHTQRCFIFLANRDDKRGTCSISLVGWPEHQVLCRMTHGQRRTRRQRSSKP